MAPGEPVSTKETLAILQTATPKAVQAVTPAAAASLGPGGGLRTESLSTGKPGLALGYTLVGLLIVIAIVAIVVAILLSVFRRAQARAGATTCAGNLHQIQTMFALCLQDHESANTQNFNWDSATMVSSVQPYAHFNGIWFCPSDSSAHNEADGSVADHMTTSYAFLDTWNPMSDVGSAETSLLTEHIWPCKLPDHPADTSQYSHAGRYNAVYLNGHLGTFRWDDPLQTTSSSGGCAATAV